MTTTATTIVAPATPEVSARPSFFTAGCTAAHSLADVEGYVVRHTLGATTRSNPDRVGHDVAVVTHSGHYPSALEQALIHRDYPRSWAVVDMLYTCGCRS